MSLLVVFLTAAAGPMLLPSRRLVLGMASLAVLLTALTVWGLVNSGASSAQDGRYAALAIAGLMTGAVVRLAFFVWRAHAEDEILRRQLPRELPERYR
jgi:hypothetical protein